MLFRFSILQNEKDYVVLEYERPVIYFNYSLINSTANFNFYLSPRSQGKMK